MCCPLLLFLSHAETRRKEREGRAPSRPRKTDETEKRAPSCPHRGRTGSLPVPACFCHKEHKGRDALRRVRDVKTTMIIPFVSFVPFLRVPVRRSREHGRATNLCRFASICGLFFTVPLCRFGMIRGCALQKGIFHSSFFILHRLYFPAVRAIRANQRGFCYADGQT